MVDGGCTPLQDISVLDLSTDIAGRYCVYLLAQAGATVVAPAYLDEDVPNRNILEHLRNAYPPTLILSNDPSKDVGSTTIVVQSAASPAFLPLNASEWRESSGIWCSVTPFGLSGVDSERRSSDLTLQARAGWVHFNGEAGHEPLKAPGDMASGVVAGVTAAMTCLAYVVGGTSGHIDVSILEALVGTNRYYETLWAFNGETMSRTGGGLSSTNRIARCRDGWVAIAISTQPQWEMTCALMGMEDLLLDPRLQTPVDRLRHTAELAPPMDNWLMQHSRMEIFHQAQAMRVPIGPILTVDELRTADHLQERNVFALTPQGDLSVPGRIALMDGCGTRSGTTQFERGVVRPAGPVVHGTPASPLRGLRALEITSWWAGPIVGRNLALLGAEVAKVESPVYPDPWRFLRGIEPGDRYHETSPFFSAANIGKRSVCIDSRTESGRKLVLSLAKIQTDKNAPSPIPNSMKM